MSTAFNHIETLVLSKNQDSVDVDEPFHYHSDVTVTRSADNLSSQCVLNIIYRSYVCEGTNCMLLETKSVFEADYSESFDLEVLLDKDSMRKKCIKMLMTAQAEHLKLLKCELSGKNISILCAEHKSEIYFNHLLGAKQIPFN